MMNGFVMMVLMVSLLFYTAFAAWLISKCRSRFMGVCVTAAAIAGGYGISHFAFYIALAVIWTVRFAAMFAVLGFVFGFYPNPNGLRENP